jgi:hypothetical protein
MGSSIERCVLCRSSQIAVAHDGPRFVTTACQGCGAMVQVEFDPPDAPALRGRIELLVPPTSTRLVHN